MYNVHTVLFETHPRCEWNREWDQFINALNGNKLRTQQNKIIVLCRYIACVIPHNYFHPKIAYATLARHRTHSIDGRGKLHARCERHTQRSQRYNDVHKLFGTPKSHPFFKVNRLYETNLVIKKSVIRERILYVEYTTRRGDRRKRASTTMAGPTVHARPLTINGMRRFSFAIRS